MGWSDRVRGALLTLLAVAFLPLGAPAQTLAVEGEVDHPAAALLRDIVDRRNFRLLDRDTVLPAGTDLGQDVVVLGARVALEGVVRGAVAVVDGAFFLRPGATVTGPIAEIAGEVFVAGTASTGERRVLPLEVRTEVSPGVEGYRVVLHSPAPPPLVSLPRFLGVAVPTFDRVNGFTVGAGVVVNVDRDTTGSRGWLEARYHTERGRWGGEAGTEAPLGGDLWLSLVAESGSFTNDAWIRGDLVNSASALLLRSDARDYYHADRATLTLERRQSEPLQPGNGFLGPRLGLLLSRDRSLQTGDPWTLFGRGDAWRANPSVAEGSIASAFAGAALAWRGATLQFAGDVGVEWAPASIGEMEFAQLVAEGDWRMSALWGHAITVYARTHLPFGTAAPPQRWSHVGGTGTLPTVERARFRGDHLVFVESRYLAPIPRLAPAFGAPPSLRLQHAAGMAWATGAGMPRWEQNLGLGIEFAVFDAMLFLNPADTPLRPELHLGTTLRGF